MTIRQLLNLFEGDGVLPRIAGGSVFLILAAALGSAAYWLVAWSASFVSMVPKLLAWAFAAWLGIVTLALAFVGLAFVFLSKEALAGSAPGASPASAPSSDVQLQALLIEFNREFSPKDRFVNSILGSMRTRDGKTYRDWMSPRTHLRIVVNPNVQDEMSRTATAMLEFKRMLAGQFALERVEQADFVGSPGINGYVFSHWSGSAGSSDVRGDQRVSTAGEILEAGRRPAPGTRSTSKEEWKRAQRQERQSRRDRG